MPWSANSAGKHCQPALLHKAVSQSTGYKANTRKEGTENNGEMSVLLQSFPYVVFQACLRGGMNKVHFTTKDVQIRDSGKVINNMLFKVFESVMLGDVSGHFDFFARQRSEQ